jgi:NAD(P)H-dependent FMN reductase
MKLAVILGTTRQGRQTSKETSWVVKTASQLSDVEVELVDLNDYPMPFFDEPVSPRYNPSRDVHPEVVKWLDKISEFDAFIFATPEYNHSIPGVLKNAIDYLTWELKHKPVTVVSHGSAGGARAATHLKEILSESQAVVIPNAVAISGMLADMIDEEGNLAEAVKANPYGPQGQLDVLLTELKWYSDALTAARSSEA